MMSGPKETCCTGKIIRPYPSPFLVSSPVAFKFLKCSRPEYSWKIARWTLNTNQSINSSFRYNYGYDIIKFRKSFYFQKLFSRAPEFTSGLLVKPVLLIFLVLYVVLLRVFTFWVPQCDVRCYFRMEMMFGSSLPPVVCRCLIYVGICLCLSIVVSNIYFGWGNLFSLNIFDCPKTRQ